MEDGVVSAHAVSWPNMFARRRGGRVIDETGAIGFEGGDVVVPSGQYESLFAR